MSHELRTPLSAIIGYAELVEEELQTSNRGDLAPDLKRIHTAGRHLLAVINDVLDLSKIEADRLDLSWQEVDLWDFIDEVQRIAEPLARGRGLELSIEIAPEVLVWTTDPMRLQQCLLNLLSNACKYTERGFVTLIVTTKDRQGTRWIQFEVVDTGIGMTPEQVENIFDHYVRADSLTVQNLQGTGLGLTITRKLCRLMGGEVAVKSALGVGSTFSLCLPERSPETGG